MKDGKKMFACAHIAMKMTTQAACAYRFSFFGHETGIMNIYLST